MTILTVVRDIDHTRDALQVDEPDLHLPTFEGEPVEGLRAKLTSTSNLEVSDAHHRLDDTARLLVTGRVTRVDHVVDERTGKLVRVETFKVVEAIEVPWDLASELLLDEDDD